MIRIYMRRKLTGMAASSLRRLALAGVAALLVGTASAGLATVFEAVAGMGAGDIGSYFNDDALVTRGGGRSCKGCGLHARNLLGDTVLPTARFEPA